jgi:hypothetical protein
MGDGVDVIIDIYDLKEGHDKYAFMEKMVTDPGVTHVLVVCDKTYAEKADARRAGVGTESQIISREVYEKVEQSKFIPVVAEFSESAEPFLPAFLKSRIWIDFSSLESVNQKWEQLVRALYGKPIYEKPQLGKPPAYLSSSNIPSNSAEPKLSLLKQALLNNTRSVDMHRREFLEACISHADALRIRQRPEVESMGEKVIEDCEKLRPVRNQIVDWVLLETEVDPSEKVTASLMGLLEQLIELKARPDGLNSWNDSWFEAHSVFVYETFLYITAGLLKTCAYSTLHEVFTSHYIKPKTERHGTEKFVDFGYFYGFSTAIEPVLNPPNRHFYSVTGELLKRQADRKDLPFSSIIEAELLVLLMACISPQVHWYPQTLFYASHDDFPFFLRATQHKHFTKLAIVSGMDTGDKLRASVKAGMERLNMNQWYDFAMSSQSFWGRMNMDKLDTLK